MQAGLHRPQALLDIGYFPFRMGGKGFQAHGGYSFFVSPPYSMAAATVERIKCPLSRVPPTIPLNLLSPLELLPN